MRSFTRFFLILLCAFAAPLHAAQVRGKVLSPDGKAVPGAAIWTGEMGRLEYSDKDGTLKQISSDAEGNFTFEIDDGAPAAFVRVQAEGFSVADSSIKAGDNQIRLQPLKGVQGEVKDDKGAPVEGAMVRLFFAPGDEKAFGDGLDRSPVNILSLLRWSSALPPVETRSGADGKWKLESVRSGIVGLNDPRFASSVGFSGMGGPQDNRPISLSAKPGATIKGTLQAPDGKPLPDVFVVSGDFFGSNPVRTDEKGAFTLEKVATSSAFIGAAPNRPIPTVIMGIPLEEDWIIPPLMIQKPLIVGQINEAPEWKATRGIEITGQLIDAATKAPIANAQINSGMSAAKKSDTEGRFRLRMAPMQTFMSVTHPDYVNYWKNVEVPANANTFDMGRVPLNRALTLTGRLVDANGQPAKSVAITAMYDTPDMGQRGESAIAAEDGKFTIKLPPSTVTLSLPEEWELVDAASGKIKLDEKTAPVEIKVRKASLHQIKGRVVTPGGKVVPGATVTVVVSRIQKPAIGNPTSNYLTTEKTTETDAQGRFTVSFAGSINLPKVTKVEAEGYFFRKNTIDKGVDGSKISTNEWPLPDTLVVEMTAQISGRVLGLDGAALAGAQVFSPDAIKFAPVTTDAQGRFTLKNLPEGEISLLAAHGKDFARVAAKTGTEAELRPVPPSVLVASMQRQLFALLLKDRFSAIDDYWDSIGTEKLLALTLQKDGALPSGDWDTAKADWSKAGTAVFYLLDQSVRRDPAWLLQNGAALLKQAPHPKEGTERFNAEAAFAAVAALKGDAQARTLGAQWLEFAATQKDKPNQAVENATRLFRLAGIALALGHKNADGLLLAAMTLADQAGKKAITDNAYHWGAALGIGGPAAFGQVDDEWPIEARINALSGAVRLMAPLDLARAKTLLDKMQALKDDAAYKKHLEAAGQQAQRMPQQSAAAERVWRRAQIKTDFDSALKWFDAKPNFDWDLRVEIVREAYAHKKFDVAARLIKPALAQGYAPEGALSYFAALSRSFDADLSAKLFAKAEELANGPNEYDYRSSTDYGFYLAAANPAKARLWLENAWQRSKNQPKDNQWLVTATQTQLGAAMVALDAVRALEMIGEVEADDNRSQGRARIAAYLLADEATRAVLRAENNY